MNRQAIAIIIAGALMPRAFAVRKSIDPDGLRGLVCPHTVRSSPLLTVGREAF